MLQQHSDVELTRRPIYVSDESLISGRQLRQLLGNCSEMHVWRLLNKPERQSLAFPKPFQINGRNYWRLGEIRQWIRDQEAKSQKVASPAVPTAAPGEARKRHQHTRRSARRRRNTRPQR